MKLKFSLILILALTLASATYAQVPGYMGKKLFVSYDLHFFPAMSNYTFNEKELTVPKSIHGINWRHGIAADYVVSRTSSLGISGSVFKTRFHHLTDTNTTFYPSVKCKSIGLNYTVFLKNKGAIAPLGPYIKITGEVITNSIETDLEKVPKTFEAPALKSFSVTFGSQKIYYNRLILDIGAHFGYVEGWFKVLPENNVQWAAQRRIIYHYVMNVHARVGFMIF